MTAIRAAQARLQHRQREADVQRGRKPDDDDSAGPDAPGKKDGRPFKRAFGQPAPKAQDNFTDPDSRIMKTGAGFEQCYNAQTAVDAHAQIIVAAQLSNCAADSGQLKAMLEAVEQNVGSKPETALADAGYRSEATLAQLSQSGIEVIVALGREGVDADRKLTT